MKKYPHLERVQSLKLWNEWKRPINKLILVPLSSGIKELKNMGEKKDTSKPKILFGELMGRKPGFYSLVQPTKQIPLIM